jgi:alanine racemase
MDRLMSRAWVEIDLGALVRNAEKFARAAGVPLLPMIKADAYGLGAERAAGALRALDPWGFGVATIEEGAELRHAGVTGRILVFSPLLPSQFDAAERLELCPVLGDAVAIAAWSTRDLPWHLMIDTGMNRAGAPWREAQAIHAVAAARPPEGVCTHFHSAELADGSREEQEARFREAVAALPFTPSLLHADNSAAIERRAPSPFGLARPGIFLYGVGTARTSLQPEPVASVRGRVVEVRVVREGDGVSYDATWRAPRAGRVATVSLGYADGYRRSCGNRTHALLRGHRVPVVGVVTMDMTMVDVTDHPCAPGDVVTFLGRDGGDLLTIADVAGDAGVSPYEFLTGLRARLPRIYTGTAA